MSRKRKGEHDGASTPRKHAAPRIEAKFAQSDLAAQQVKPDEEAISSSSSSDEDEDESPSSADQAGIQQQGFVPPSEADYPRTWKRGRELMVGEILEKQTSADRILVTGASHAGKCLFTHYLAKTLISPPVELRLMPLKSMALLYLDPSRAGNGFSGHITMRIVNGLDENRKNFTIVQERNIPVGLFGHREDPSLFLAALTELLEDLRHLSTSMSMIICCPSVERESDRGLAVRTMEGVMKAVDPDHLCFLHHGSQQTKDVMEAVAAMKKLDTTFWNMESIADPRMALMLNSSSRRRTVLQEAFSPNIVSSHGPLSSRKPYAISYDTSSSCCDILACRVFGDLQPNHPFMLSRLLNGSVVAITLCDRGNDIDPCIGESDSIPYFTENGASSLRNLNTVGLGLITGINHKQKLLFIHTTELVAGVLAQTYSERIVLVHGIANSPGWAYEDDLQAGFEPYYLGRARKGMQTVKSRRFKKKG